MYNNAKDKNSQDDIRESREKKPAHVQYMLTYSAIAVT